MGITYNPRTITDGLVLCLDAGNSKSYPGSGTTWTDLSGNGNTGTLTNGPTYSSANGGSIVFDGADDVVNSISISSFSSPTIEMWIYDTRSSGQRDILTYNSTVSSFTFNGTTFRTDRNGVARRTISEVGQPPLNQWYRFCYTMNGDLYINQIRYNNASGTDTDFGVLTLGNSRTNINNRLNGNIASVKIYNRALSAAEVSQNYNALKSRYI